jgi:hypothetical protein
MTDNKPTCGAEACFCGKRPNLVCVREPGAHIRHQADDGTKFIRTPGGFWITEPQATKETP